MFAVLCRYNACFCYKLFNIKKYQKFSNRCWKVLCCNTYSNTTKQKLFSIVFIFFNFVSGIVFSIESCHLLKLSFLFCFLTSIRKTYKLWLWVIVEFSARTKNWNISQLFCFFQKKIQKGKLYYFSFKTKRKLYSNMHTMSAEPIFYKKKSKNITIETVWRVFKCVMRQQFNYYRSFRVVLLRLVYSCWKICITITFGWRVLNTENECDKITEKPMIIIITIMVVTYIDFFFSFISLVFFVHNNMLSVQRYLSLVMQTKRFNFLALTIGHK